MTDAEKRLWWGIRLQQVRGLIFYRQKPIGNYIVDFYCPKAKLAIEIDGNTYPLDTIPVDAPQKVKDAINRFYLFAEPFEQLTKIQTTAQYKD